jgi:transcriptional regulator with XRE-family HTH domain
MELPTGNLLRAGRALAGLTGTQLAKEAGCDASTISRLEAAGTKHVAGHTLKVEAIVQALKRKGVQVIDDHTVTLIKKPRR